jgi:hypothetical protein
LIQSSLQQLGNDSDDAALYESMLVDIATVFYGRNAKAALCAWRATDKYAVRAEYAGIATRAALDRNKQCMTRVWLPDQVSAAVS